MLSRVSARCENEDSKASGTSQTPCPSVSPSIGRDTLQVAEDDGADNDRDGDDTSAADNDVAAATDNDMELHYFTSTSTPDGLQLLTLSPSTSSVR